MDSSSSSANLCIEDSKKFCRCGLQAKLKTSKTTTNPGKKFYGCTKYKTKQSYAMGLHRDEERQTEIDNLKNEIKDMQKKIDDLELKNQMLQEILTEQRSSGNFSWKLVLMLAFVMWIMMYLA
ncbi:hypothetical protein RHSIM_Rhsim02G0149200 [Rhododendron simsii]|uniref:GRF-type domain-containing protein n=1 Tax=Rhododendron simsii TaxID=118357 RepID=A0A834HFG7_RHOSS|nr:hypothetical protein RHSIM_Rhsim02G0149200 [Rhododendron simsii]